jgi:hypothetical protein
MYYGAFCPAEVVGLKEADVKLPEMGWGTAQHSALSTCLNSGVDATEVAERAGKSVEVLLSRYAKCINGRQEIANRKIEELLRD